VIGLNDTSLLAHKTIDSFLNTLDEKNVRLLLDLAKLASVYRLGPTAESILINTFICKNSNLFNYVLQNISWIIIYKSLIFQLLYTLTNI